MTSATAINNIGSDIPRGSTTRTDHSLRRWASGLFLFAILGGVSGTVGLAVGFLMIGGVVVPSTRLYTMSTMLIGASFVLFGLAAHCLDKADAADKAIRLESCRQSGLQK